MLFTVQTYLEDYLRRRNINDADGYGVRLANLYFHSRSEMDTDEFLRKVRRIKTVVFVNNDIEDRAEFEKSLIGLLDKQFKKKLLSDNPSFPGGIELERNKFQRLPRKTVDTMLKEFKSAVEARAIDAFWNSRKKGTLRLKPEKIAQSLFAVFAKGVLRDRGIILREISSGTGFVDIGLVFSSTLHLIEIKMLTKHFEGIEQLNRYMHIEKRNRGYLVIIDALKPESKLKLSKSIKMPDGLIKIYIVDINPSPPSSLNK